MKYKNSEGATGVRPLRMKSQIQPSGLYRDVKNALGNGDDEIVAQGHVRMASEPERTGSPGAVQQAGRLVSDSELVKRILRNPYANMARKLDDPPEFATQNSRRRNAGPIYLPAPNKNAYSSTSRPFMRVNTRSPSPKMYTVRSPPPTDRPYRHLSQRPDGGIARVDTLPSQESDSHESKSSATGHNYPPTISRIPSIPSPPNTPPTALFRSGTINTTSTVPSSPTQTGAYTQSRHNTCSTMASSVASNKVSPIIGPSPFSNPSPCPKPSPFLSSPPLHNPQTHYSPPTISTPHPSPTPHQINPSQESIALTEQLVREGIYGGIVYGIGVPPSSLANQIPKPSAPHLRRKNKRAEKRTQFLSSEKRKGRETRDEYAGEG
ncbi:hypothetical protein DID88_000494 [Monilinia fructigena]|uniref:Uncharacterized protein n=1 Tax=Monilinia fructigena TaxID=38457 RepID=A0A395IHR3_9HELO|nr:hypothetical protein DID88_000494 [Monilinia fructigena]